MPPDTEDPTRRPRIVLYVDDSGHWHSAAKLLGEFVRRAGGHVIVTSTLLLPGSRNRALAEARRILALPEDRLELRGRPGLIEYVLPDLARETHADLVVVGRLGSADRLTSGLIAYLVSKRTPANVLIARHPPTSLRSVLVCTEGKEHGTANFENGARIAQAFGARLTVLHVASQMGLSDRGVEELEEDLRDYVNSDAPEADHLRELRDRMAQMGLPGEVVVRRGLVIDEILAAIQEGHHDLLVIGAHKSQDHALLYEDLASPLLRASPISTLVVRDPPAPPPPAPSS